MDFTQKDTEVYDAYMGIFHQDTYPHSSNPNNIFERKRCHILDVICHLLCEMRVPHYLQADEVQKTIPLFNVFPYTPFDRWIAIWRFLKINLCFTLKGN